LRKAFVYYRDLVAELLEVRDTRRTAEPERRPQVQS